MSPSAAPATQSAAASPATNPGPSAPPEPAVYGYFGDGVWHWVYHTVVAWSILISHVPSPGVRRIDRHFNWWTSPSSLKHPPLNGHYTDGTPPALFFPPGFLLGLLRSSGERRPGSGYDPWLSLSKRIGKMVNLQETSFYMFLPIVIDANKGFAADEFGPTFDGWSKLPVSYLISIYLSTYLSIYIHMCIYVYLCIHHLHIYIYVYIYVCVCMYIYT